MSTNSNRLFLLPSARRPRNAMCYCRKKPSGHVAGYDGCNAPRSCNHLEPRCGDCGATNFVTLGTRGELMARYRCDICGGQEIYIDARCETLLDPITVDQLLYNLGMQD